ERRCPRPPLAPPGKAALGDNAAIHEVRDLDRLCLLHGKPHGRSMFSETMRLDSTALRVGWVVENTDEGLIRRSPKTRLSRNGERGTSAKHLSHPPTGGSRGTRIVR